MRIFRMIGSMINDIEYQEWFGKYMGVGILISGTIDLCALLLLLDAEAHGETVVFFKWALPIQFILWGVFIVRATVRDSTPYFKQKWEQAKTSESDKDTLLRGSKERA